MVSPDDRKYWENLEDEVDNYKRGGHPIDFFDKSKTTQDCIYQQKIADIRSKYYPFWYPVFFYLCAKPCFIDYHL